MSDRRQFLRNCRSLLLAGGASHLLRLGAVEAAAQTVSPDFKALVCIFMFGGNDANNMVIPLDATNYARYQTLRPNLAHASTAARAIAGAGGRAYGLHPSLPKLQALYNQGRMATVLNVGMLVRPTRKSDLGTPGFDLPRNLYSHSDQTLQWQTSNPNGGGPGWGGRIADALNNQNSNGFPMGVSTQGNAALLQGVVSRPVTLTPGSTLGLQGFGSSNGMAAREAGLQKVLTFSSGMQLITSANAVLSRSIQGSLAVNQALASGRPFATVFPQTGLGRQLEQVAKVIQVREALGMTRQIFFCGIGGFDTHSDQLPSHANLMTTLDDAVAAFYAATQEMQLEDKVTTFTESEFSRTMNPSATNGSDHAWGGHHFVIGGRNVAGGTTYGRYPELALRGPDDAGDRGLWIPDVSLEQYAATFGQWFGIPTAQLPALFPNLTNFAQPTLGFLA